MATMANGRVNPVVNASPPKRLDVATSNSADALASSRAGICDGVPSTEVYIYRL